MTLPVRALALLSCTLLVRDAWACRVPPPRQLMSVEEQVALASDVSLATVVAATPLGGGEVEYRFAVLQRLAGPDRNGFELRGHGAGKPGATGFRFDVPGGAGERETSTFDHHTAPAFWQRGGGRTMNGADCQIRPVFTVGDSYLVFLDAPWTWRSFERIEVVDGAVDESDQWLAYVKAALARRAAPAAPPTR